jgi:hypothetical protein
LPSPTPPVYHRLENLKSNSYILTRHEIKANKVQFLYTNHIY